MIRSIDELKQAYSAGEKMKFMMFWGHTPPQDGWVNQSCLSQWYPCNFCVDDIKYSSAEQFMMAHKALLFNDLEIYDEILKESNPAKVKALGRLVKGFIKKRWDEASFDIVVKGNIAKFSQNPKLHEFLLATGSKIIVEASPRDLILGIGLSKDNPSAQNPFEWRGKNMFNILIR